MPVLGTKPTRSGGLTKYEGLAHTGESNFNEGPRPVNMHYVHKRIVVVPDVAFHPLSLGGGNNAAVLFKFHNFIVQRGLPTYYAISSRYVRTIQPQPKAVR